MFHMPSRIDRYEIKTLIGAGGMGSLYLARDTNPNTNRLVALKLLLANLDSGDLRERFAREARALAALNHPNIVNIFDSGEFQGSPFIVMEYVRGETIAEKIKRRAVMTLGQKIKMMVELCSGLQHAHEAGIIHRDIKPANLMVDRHGRLKILDFGIARVSEGLTRMGVQVTQLNMRIGTPGYMSPEQIEGGEIDRRSDIFAVGAVCYEILSYREAFTGTNTRQVENKVLQTHPEPLLSLIPDLDPEVEKIITRALAKDPEQRYQDATALEEAFDRVRWRLGPAETPPPAPVRHTDPSLIPAKKAGHDSRAEVVYQRCLAIYADGAHDAARRFAIEALAEDPDHEGAIDFMKRFGPSSWPPLPQRSQAQAPYTSSGPTVLRTESHPIGTMTGNAETVLSTGTHPSGASSRGRTGSRGRFGKGAQVAALVTAAVVLVGAAVAAGFWIWGGGSGLMLTVTKPEGGTISGSGINCGTGGSDCSTSLSKGDAVDLRAEADPGFLFGGFTGDCKQGGRTIMSAARTCGAAFTKVPDVAAAPSFTLTIDLPKGGTIVSEGITCGTMGSECSMNHPQGKLVPMKALADPEFTFKGFVGEGCSRSGETVMNVARRCGAVFVKDAGRVAGNTSSSAGGPGGVGTASNGTTRSPAGRPGSPAGGGSGASGGGGGGSVYVPPTNAPTLPGGVTPTSPGGEAAKPPPPPPTADGIARDEIKDLLKAYKTAWESLDISQIQRLYPAAPVGSLKYTFSQWKAVEFNYEGEPEFVNLDPGLGTATVKIGSTVKPEYKGPKEKPQNLNNVFTLRRYDGVWKFQDVKSTPKK